MIRRDGAYGGHHIGTARMGRDPAKGVVDADCRVFGVDNLYVAGSAVFPTSGQANPTLTIVALADAARPTHRSKGKPPCRDSSAAHLRSHPPVRTGGAFNPPRLARQ